MRPRVGRLVVGGGLVSVLALGGCDGQGGTQATSTPTIRQSVTDVDNPPDQWRWVTRGEYRAPVQTAPPSARVDNLERGEIYVSAAGCLIVVTHWGPKEGFVALFDGEPMLDSVVREIGTGQTQRVEVTFSGAPQTAPSAIPECGGATQYMPFHRLRIEK